MPENASLGDTLGQTESDFVEREPTPRVLMKLGIQLHLAILSISNTVYFLNIFGVERARATVHSWVHKADLQPEAGRAPDHIVVDETVIQLNNEQYWPYAAVDPKTNGLLHTKLEPTTAKVLSHSFLTELSEKHDAPDAVFLVDGSHSLQNACHRHGLDFRYEKRGNRNSIERVFYEVK